MNTRFLLAIVFIAGVSSGWLGKTWFGSAPSKLIAKVTDNNQNAPPPRSTSEAQGTSQSLGSNIEYSSTTSTTNVDFSDSSPVQEQRYSSGQKSADILFIRLLNDRLYYEAMLLYQETAQQNEKATTQLKSALLDHLSILSKTRNNTDFSDLTESYLTIYYDDIDVLLLLADFNQTNGSYLETVDVYLLAKTYAYTDIDQQDVLTRFNGFVKEIDNIYTNKKDWLSLINFYSHINTSGLMTSSYQYRQALAFLGNGDELSATEHLKQLASDSLVGEQATIALNKLSGQTGGLAIRSETFRDNSETIALQQRGNQYLVDLTVGRQDNVKLLIDTGASMTTLSQASFYALKSNGDAVEQDRRIFHTANGVVQGTVYSVPELTIGPHILKNTQIAVIDFDMAEGIDGLLGMNVLGKFRFQIDQENKNLILNRK